MSSAPENDAPLLDPVQEEAVAGHIARGVGLVPGLGTDARVVFLSVQNWQNYRYLTTMRIYGDDFNIF